MICGALYFQQWAESELKKAQEIRRSLRKDLKHLEEELCFLNHHKQTLTFLEKKGWFTPSNRLIAAEKIKEAAVSLNKINFTFEPEEIEEHKTGYSFRITRLILETSALLDTQVYDFIENILRSFPGILMLRKLSLARDEPFNFSALNQNKQLNFVRGEIIFEWVAMGGKNDAD